MNHFDNIIIGFGKGGKTLAGALAGAGQSVALIEQSPLMYGGTCINVACIPTKALEHRARLSQAQGGDFAQRAERYRAAIGYKRQLTAMLRQKNYDKAVAAGVAVRTGHASFVDPHTVRVEDASGAGEELTGERIFLNTGALPFLPPIPGLRDNPCVYTSETLMEREELPARLAIIGGGYIGLEFSSYFANFGAQVTVIQDGADFIPREDREVAAAVLQSLTARGVEVIRSAQVREVAAADGAAAVRIATAEDERTIAADAVLVATGRRPNLAGLNLAAAGVGLNERGGLIVDEHLRTTVPHIWALGDVAGGLQFTYISLDDYRIVAGQLLGDGTRTTRNRGAVPYSVFLDPPLSRVGMTEDEAKAAGFDTMVARLPAAAVPKAHILERPAGLLKLIADRRTGRILGAHFFCAESHELINLVKLAMDAGLPYTVLRDGIYTHPTMTEALGDLLAGIK